MKVSAGSVQQLDKTRPRNKCRKWRLVAHVDGVRRSKRFTGSVTEAKAALKEWKAELSKKPSDGLTTAQYADRWMGYREQSGQYSAGTCKAIRTRMGAWCRSALGSMRLAEVTQADVEEAMLWIRDNPVSGGRLSGTTLASHLETLKTMCKHAEAAGAIPRDPTRHVKAPKHDTERREALSPLELELLLNRLDGMEVDGYVMAVYLMACLGLRKGEALGLMAEDVRGGRVEVRRSASSADNSIGPTKTQAGVRTLPMPQRLASKMAEWSQVRADEGYPDADMVCCDRQGRPIKPQSMHWWWLSHRDALGCTGMVMHQLRHSNLSMMARALPSAFDLQRWAGWSSIAPARVYIHTDLDALEAAAGAVLTDGTLQKRST